MRAERLSAGCSGRMAKGAQLEDLHGGRGGDGSRPLANRFCSQHSPCRDGLGTSGGAKRSRDAPCKVLLDLKKPVELFRGG